MLSLVVMVEFSHHTRDWNQSIDTRTISRASQAQVSNTVISMYGQELMICVLYWLYNVVVPCCDWTFLHLKSCLLVNLKCFMAGQHVEVTIDLKYDIILLWEGLSSPLLCWPLKPYILTRRQFFRWRNVQSQQETTTLYIQYSTQVMSSYHTLTWQYEQCALCCV